MATINGTNGSDFLNGTAQADLILGRGRRDVLLGNGGNDRLRGGRGKDTLDGGAGNDDLLGQGGDDTLIGSAGNDLLDGGNKSDTADYSDLGQAITLEAVGVISKGSLGEDQILNIETIVGAEGEDNAIDGSTGTSGSTSFNINLEDETLKVKGIPGLGDINFAIENFVDAIGTSQDDKITGSSDDNVIQGGEGADKFFGSAGDDVIAGNRLNGIDDGSKDTINYKGLGEAITLTATGIVEKGDLGTDELIRVEKIVGDKGLDNVIDGSGADASIDVDLAAKSLVVDINTPALNTTLERTVVNFVDVVGGSGNDSIADDSGNNELVGGRGQDTLDASGGNDTLSGGNGRDTLIADFGQDVLSGGNGADTFVLGANGQVSFDDAGTGDFASITDFQSGVDTIQLAGFASLFSSISLGSNSQLAVDTNNNGAFDNGDELIANINGSFDFANDVTFA